MFHEKVYLVIICKIIYGIQFACEYMHACIRICTYVPPCTICMMLCYVYVFEYPYCRNSCTINTPIHLGSKSNFPS